MAVRIELRKVRNYALKDVSLEVRGGDTLAVIGPTGAGKTTLLDVVAGFAPYDGAVFFDGAPVDRRPARRRSVGYVFQDTRLFPHMDVRSNIAFGLVSRGMPRRKAAEKADGLIALAGLDPLADRYPRTLSGGEKRRVALMRALATEPDILLLDEPLSSLDPATARCIGMELRRILERFCITAIYVTHDLQEAAEMACAISVINEGRIEQSGTLEDVLFGAVNEKVYEFVGAPNVLACETFNRIGHGLAEAGCGGITLLVPDDGRDVSRIAVYPRDVHLSRDMPPGPGVNRFKVTVVDSRDFGSVARVRVRAACGMLVSELPREACEAMHIGPGGEAYVILKMGGIRAIPARA